MADEVVDQTPSSKIINISVISPEETLYNGQARALTCHNEDGDFDVLPLHTNFISLIDKYIIIHQLSGENKKITIEKALMKAIENNITILLNIDLTERDVILKALFKQVEGALPFTKK
jgi:F0F1-type ATP synthase epsilon subunit